MGNDDPAVPAGEQGLLGPVLPVDVTTQVRSASVTIVLAMMWLVS
ncbi:hypothetical protein ACQPXS_46770 (plasmid) [Streptomyces sp. CA-142005]